MVGGIDNAQTSTSMRHMGGWIAVASGSVYSSAKASASMYL